MAATTGRLLALAVAFLLAAAACSDGDDDVGAELDAEADAAATSSTTTAPPSSTTTTEATSTTLSDLELAEAEIREVVTEWYQFPIDTSQDDSDSRLDFLTGLLRQRVIESNTRLETDGVIRRSRLPAPIEITGVAVELDDGTAEVEACTGSADEFVDAETLNVISADDPGDTTSSAFQLQLIDGQWKIAEWISSASGDEPITCEVGQ